MAYESDEEIWKHHFYHSYNKPKKKKKARQSKDKANCEHRFKILTSDLLGNLEQMINIKGFSGKGRKHI